MHTSTGVAAQVPHCFSNLFVGTEKSCQGCSLATPCKKEQANVPGCFGQFDGNADECAGTPLSLACEIMARCSNAKNRHITTTESQ